MHERDYRLKTIIELERYLEDECYSFSEISIGNHRAPEGLYLEKSNDMFIFGYSEKGLKTIIKTFDTEEASVAYAFRELTSGQWFKAHLAASAFDETLIAKAENELRERSVRFIRNDIPRYDSEHGTLYRIFVFGKDIRKLSGQQ